MRRQAIKTCNLKVFKEDDNDAFCSSQYQSTRIHHNCKAAAQSHSRIKCAITWQHSSSAQEWWWKLPSNTDDPNPPSTYNVKINNGILGCDNTHNGERGEVGIQCWQIWYHKRLIPADQGYSPQCQRLPKIKGSSICQYGYESWDIIIVQYMSHLLHIFVCIHYWRWMIVQILSLDSVISLGFCHLFCHGYWCTYSSQNLQIMWWIQCKDQIQQSSSIWYVTATSTLKSKT